LAVGIVQNFGGKVKWRMEIGIGVIRRTGNQKIVHILEKQGHLFPVNHQDLIFKTAQMELEKA